MNTTQRMPASWPHHRVDDRGTGVVRSSARPSPARAVRDAVAGEGIAVGAQNIHHELAGATRAR